MIKINHISIDGLFGYLSPKFSPSAENITIIHGPNGCGKTSLLRLIKASLSIDSAELKRIEFKYIEIKFSNNTVLKISKHNTIPGKEAATESKPKRAVGRAYVTYELTDANSNTESHTLDPLKFSDLGMSGAVEYIDRTISGIIRVGADAWLNRDTGEQFDSEELIDRYSEIIPNSRRTPIPPWMETLRKEASPHLVQTQRLLRFQQITSSHYESRHSRSINEVVEIYSSEIKETISKKLAESVSIAQSRDRTFPTRLLEGEGMPDVSEEILREKFNALEEKRKKLILAGLMGEEQGMPLPSKKLDNMEKKVIWLYLGDVEQKLEIFSDLQNRIEAFMQILNEKLQPKGKSFSITRDDGFCFNSEHGSMRKLPASVLSSGEQHQIVLFYELLFRTKNHSLILIDEPEISLHVNWQRVFLQDLERVVALTKANVIIATHSPQIINNRWDLTAALDGGIRES
ncbi:ATPase [Opitutaceae bacterium TAV5]|nr:ATPase [Opitutaceae bacterium TAV5]